MKKLSRDYLLQSSRSGNLRWQNELSRKNKRYNPDKAPPIKKLLGYTIISAPETISIYDASGKNSNYKRTLQFLDELKSKFKYGNCIVDFSSTKTVTAAALVVVYAEIDAAGKDRIGKASIRWSQKSNSVNRILKSSNLAKLVHGYDISYSLASGRTMPIVSSTGKKQMDEIIDYIQGRIYKDKMSPATEHIYGDAVSETINNVGLHAYPGLSTEDKRWWLMCETFGKTLYLAIYDRGVGIPKTVVDRPWFLASVKSSHPLEYQALLKEFPNFEQLGISAYIPKKIPDEQLIYLSMQGDVSGTKKDKHGQGSKSIMALVGETTGGLLWVFSNHGLYNFSNEDEKPGLTALGKKFPGTLVQWNIEIP